MNDQSNKRTSFRPRIGAITLGVDDLERALAFYRDGLGLESDGVIGTEFEGDETKPSGSVAMFKLENGLDISLYPRSELAKDAGIPVTAIAGSGFSLGYFVDSREEVDQTLQLAKDAGGTILGPTHERPWGIYSGYFSDPDGHLWEVVYFLNA